MSSFQKLFNAILPGIFVDETGTAANRQAAEQNEIDDTEKEEDEATPTDRIITRRITKALDQETAEIQDHPRQSESKGEVPIDLTVGFVEPKANAEPGAGKEKEGHKPSKDGQNTPTLEKHLIEIGDGIKRGSAIATDVTVDIGDERKEEREQYRAHREDERPIVILPQAPFFQGGVPGHHDGIDVGGRVFSFPIDDLIDSDVKEIRQFLQGRDIGNRIAAFPFADRLGRNLKDIRLILLTQVLFAP